MTDLEQILPLWRELSAAGTEYVLATVVAVEGSGYRKPGARMLIASDGRRAGTISGGCLEGDVARKAFWNTANGAHVRRYSTRAEDGDVPYGMGCGGVILLLLERSATAGPLLQRLARSFEAREPLAVATVLEGAWAGVRSFFPPEPVGEIPEAATPLPPTDAAQLDRLAEQAFADRVSYSRRLDSGAEETPAVRVEFHEARPGLHIFGAGDDAIPLVRQARQLGWYVSVTDGRSHLATHARFPEAHEAIASGAESLSLHGARPTDAAVVMTHSLDQDRRFLGALLGRELAYIGVLGPARRTLDMLGQIAGERGLFDEAAEAQARAWMDALHAPIGLELGADNSASIALEILAEVHRELRGGSGRSLREVRRARRQESARPAAIAQNAAI